MHLKNNYIKNWKFYYKISFALLGSLTCIIPWLINLFNPAIFDKGDYTFNYFSYFTTQSNIFVWLWFYIAAFKIDKEGKIKSLSYNLTLIITVYISVTFIIYNLVLLPINPPKNAEHWIRSVIEHLICPIGMVIYFIFFYEANKVTNNNTYWKKEVWKLYPYLIGYATFMIIRGEFRYRIDKPDPYPYFFLNIHQKTLDLPGAIWLIIVLLIVSSLLFSLGTGYNTLAYSKKQKNLNKK